MSATYTLQLTNSGISSVNNLVGDIYVRGSGTTRVWVDGQTIQINASGSGGSSGITSINAATGPSILLREQLGSGIEILTSGNSIFWGLKPIDLTSSGFATYASLHTSGYIRNIDFVSSGFVQGSTITGSGYITLSDMLVSGYLRHGDLLGSGYVRTLNGLKNAVVLVGSGGMRIWTDGQNIEIAAAGADGYQYVTIGDIANSGFALKSELTTSGYLKASDRMYPVDSRAVSGNIIPDSSGSWNLGSSTKFFHQIWANSGIFQSGVSVSGIELINKINDVGGPFIQILPGYGVIDLPTQDNKIYINVSGIDLTTSGFVTSSQITTSGYELHSDLLVSGYLRHQDLLTSGYVRTLNGLKNAVTIAGSGHLINWNDGQTIEIAVDSDVALYSSLHTSGYIRNVDFVSSGFITKTEVALSGFATRAELTTSGYLKASDRMYPVDARLVSGHIDMDASGKWNIGTDTTRVDKVWANSGIYQSGVSVSGFPVIYQIDSLSGPVVRINTGAGIAKFTSDHTITLAADLTSSGFTTIAAVEADLHTSGYIRNVDFVSSGFITKAEVASSGFATRAELTTSGYLKFSDYKTPVDARQASGNIVPDISGAWNLGSSTKFWHQVWANSGIFQSGVSVSGVELINKINDLGGPFVTLTGSGGVNVWVDGRTIQISAPAGSQSYFPVDARAVSGHILMGTTSGLYDFGSLENPAHALYAQSGIFTSGVTVSGLPLYLKINGIAGPQLTIQGGYGVDVGLVNDSANRTIWINVSGRIGQHGNAFGTLDHYIESENTAAGGIYVKSTVEAGTLVVTKIAGPTFTNGWGISGIQNYVSTSTQSGVRIFTSGFLQESGTAFNRRFIYPHDGMGIAGQTYKSNGVYTLNASGTVSNPNDNKRMSSHYLSAAAANGVATIGAIVSQNLRPQDNVSFRCDYKPMVSGGTTTHWIGLLNLNPNVSGTNTLFRDTRFQCVALHRMNGQPNWWFITKGVNATAQSGAVPTTVLPLVDNNWHDIHIYTHDQGTTWHLEIDDDWIASQATEVPTSGSNIGPLVQIAGNAVSFRNSYLSTRVNSPNPMPFTI